ncbi:MAG: molybdopterin-dependent oxidoreductase [Acidobacteria bacterium]|nr:molybdopterin-dependent oxidoreductase [Acidobacteriota bacterium]
MTLAVGAALVAFALPLCRRGIVLSDEGYLLLQGLDMPGASARHDGDVPAALAQAHKLVQVEYLLPYLSHVPMEPVNCTAHVRADGCDVWVGTQGQTQALKKTA